MKTKIFSYKGHLAAETDINKGSFINNPKESGQLGVVVNIKEIEITQDAINILKSAGRAGGSFSNIMLTKHIHATTNEPTGEASIGLLGFWKHNFGKDVKIGRDCDKSILDSMTPVELDAPQDYKDFIDSL